MGNYELTTAELAVVIEATVTMIDNCKESEVKERLIKHLDTLLTAQAERASRVCISPDLDPLIV
jgi:hypothetical protein